MDPYFVYEAYFTLLGPWSSVELQYSMKFSEDTSTAGTWSAQWAKVGPLSSHCEELDRRLWGRMEAAVRGVADTLHLGFLSALIRIVKWPDW